MTIETKTFVRRPFKVEAVQVNEENMTEVAKWCNGTVRTDSDGKRFIKVYVHRPLSERQTTAFTDDWILYAKTGFKVYPQRSFEGAFVPADE